MGGQNGSQVLRSCPPRENVLRNLADKAFDRPICEALLDQRFFNGIGNYLRAEILYRSAGKPWPKGWGSWVYPHFPPCSIVPFPHPTAGSGYPPSRRPARCWRHCSSTGR